MGLLVSAIEMEGDSMPRNQIKPTNPNGIRRMTSGLDVDCEHDSNVTLSVFGPSYMVR